MKTLEERFWAKVDKTETCWLWTGSKVRKGYGGFRLDTGRLRSAHRVAYELLVGPIPEGMLLDHICHVPACVNPEHLRPVTRKQNAENRSAVNRNNTSGARGVIWNPLNNNWRVQVGHHGRIFQASFKDFDKAREWAVELRNELFTHNDGDRAAS